MNKKIIIAFAVLVIVILCLVGYIVYPLIYNKIYSKGFDEGFEMAQYSIAHQIRNTGSIPVYEPNNGTIIWYSLNQICGGGG